MSGKKFTAAAAKVDQAKIYDVPQAVALVKSAAFAKFNETVEVALRLGVDPKHADQMVRGTVVLPHGLGKTTRVAVVASGEKIKEAEAAGADVVGGDDLVAKIQAGMLDFEALVATPGPDVEPPRPRPRRLLIERASVLGRGQLDGLGRRGARQNLLGVARGKAAGGLLRNDGLD